jgi:hypothetical protein
MARLVAPGVTGSNAGTEFSGVLDRADGSSASGDRAKFAQDLLGGLGVPVTSENVRAVAAWADAEGTKAAFNPLATTQGASGATNFNGVGVKNYASYEDGLAATLRTLTNGRYGPILDALRRGTSAEAVAQAVAASPWGTGQGVLRVLAQH